MDTKVFSDLVLAAAKARGVAAEVYASTENSFEANACGGEIDRCDVSMSGGLSLRVSVDGKNGYAYTERFEDAETLVERAMDNARAIEETDEHPMQMPQTYATLSEQRGALDGMPAQERIAHALELEKLALAADERVKRVIYCSMIASSGETIIKNTLGLSAVRNGALSACYVCPSVEENGEVQTGMGFRTGAEALELSDCAREAVENALEQLGGKPVLSGGYRVLIRNLAMADLLQAFSPMFSAAEAQKGCSLLAGKEGETIAAPCVSILDDPFDPAAPRAFDDEGTPCQKKRIVDGGALTTLLHNLKTAKKAGVCSTGNAAKASVASPVDVSPSVFSIEAGEWDEAALLQKLGNGLLITELSGLHAGLSCISGDFSLKAGGKLVENGKVVRSVSGVTVAGNFLTLLQNVEAVGADLRYGLPLTSGLCPASPSVLVTELAVAGE